MLAGIFNFIESEKIKGKSLYCPMDICRARASSCSPVFSILKSLKNLKETLYTISWIFVEPGSVPARRYFQF
jgi:hypothetical protein